MVDITQFVIGPLENNTYVVADERRQCLVVDPAIGSGEVAQWIKERGLQPVAVLLTHGHFDHIMGLDELGAAFGDLPVYIHSEDRDLLTNPAQNGSAMIGQAYRYEGPVELLQVGDMVVAGFRFQVRHVPGHTRGGCAFLFGGDCLTGDSLFCGSIGRTDLAGGDSATLLQSIREQLMTLPEETVVYTGHGPDSTIAIEARTNPFLQYF